MDSQAHNALWMRRALWLVVGTMAHNLAEAVVAVGSGVLAPGSAGLPAPGHRGNIPVIVLPDEERAFGIPIRSSVLAAVVCVVAPIENVNMEE